MALGKIIVVSDIPENREAFGEQFEQFVFATGEHEELVEILNGIIKDRGVLEEKKPLLRKRAEKYFDIRINTREIETIYDRLIGPFS
jgi:glycosyltransferase involved in cell wall biosynthesis